MGRFDFRRLIPARRSQADLDAFAREWPGDVRIEIIGGNRPGAEITVTVHNAKLGDLTFSHTLVETGLFMGTVLGEVWQLLKRYAHNGGRLRNITDDGPEGRCQLCGGLHPQTNDAEDFRALRRLLHRRADRIDKRRSAGFHGQHSPGNAEDDAHQDHQEFQQLLEEHDERIRGGGRPPAEMVD